MASTGLSICTTSKPPLVPRTSAVTAAASSSPSPSASHRCRSSLVFRSLCGSGSFVAALSKNCSRGRRRQFVVCMAPDEEKLTRRNPLDFPIEWERPKPGRRPDIFPQFSPMKAPIPPPLPYDPPEEDEEEEEKKKEEEEEDPEKEEEPDKPEKQ